MIRAYNTKDLDLEGESIKNTSISPSLKKPPSTTFPHFPQTTHPSTITSICSSLTSFCLPLALRLSQFQTTNQTVCILIHQYKYRNRNSPPPGVYEALIEEDGTEVHNLVLEAPGSGSAEGDIAIASAKFARRNLAKRDGTGCTGHPLNAADTNKANGMLGKSFSTHSNVASPLSSTRHGQLIFRRCRRSMRWWCFRQRRSFILFHLGMYCRLGL
jgi:hypothetical protein